MLLFLLFLMSANTDSLIGYVKKVLLMLQLLLLHCVVVDVDDDDEKKYREDDRYAVAAWIALKLP